MRLFTKTKDGGPNSPVDGYFLVEIKPLFSIALLKFNKGSREAFHTHAFNAYTWFLWGDLTEEKFDGSLKKYRRSVFPKYTSRDNNHRVIAHKTSWCFTIRGPWKDIWTEDHDGTKTTLSHGRVVVKTEKS